MGPGTVTHAFNRNTWEAEAEKKKKSEFHASYGCVEQKQIYYFFKKKVWGMS